MKSNLITEVTAFQEKKLWAQDWQNPQQVMKWLRSKGFKQKGAGMFGAAFVHPNYPRIVKISKREDKCWLKFARWTLNLTSHPNVPYINWVRVYGTEDQFFIAVVEKLAPFNRSAIMNTVDLPGLAWLYLEDHLWAETDHIVIDRFKREGINRNQIRNYLIRSSKYKRFVQVFNTVERMARGGCSSDIHEGNIMYRPSDGHLVVIDPLADMDAAFG